MKEIQKRNLNIDVSNLQVEDTEGEKYLTGFIPYNSKSQRMFIGYSDCEYEVISPTAFNKTLGDNAKVLANYNHDPSAILGNTKSGTLELTNSETGLICRCKLPHSDIGMRAFETVNRGDVRNLSFEFYPYSWTEDGDTVTLTSAKLTAVSFAVSEPAYEETDSFASLRSLFQKRNIDVEKIEAAIKENKVDSSDKEQAESIKNLVTILNDMLPKEETRVEQPKADNKQQSAAVEPEQPHVDIQVEDTDEYKAQVERFKELQKEIAEL